MTDAPRPAVFADRDGTLIDDTGYLHEPERVSLVPGVSAGIKSLNEAGVLVIAVSNQSGISRGYYGEAEYHAVQRRLEDLLATDGARLDASYFCPHYPPITGPCDCRKPHTKLFLDARRDLAVDFRQSWWVGDKLSDVSPARELGGKSVLVLTGKGFLHQGQARALGAAISPDFAAAVDVILGRR